MTNRLDTPEWKKNASGAMPDQEFWELVAELGWKKGANSKEVKKLFMKLVPSSEKAEAFRATLGRMTGALSRAVQKYERDNDVQVEASDDGFSDLLNHVVGRGKNEYDHAMANPALVVERAKKRDYTESFSYVVPWKDDYEKQGNIGPFKEWAERNIENYKALLKIPFYREVHDDAKLVITAMDLLLKGDVQGFLASKPRVDQSLSRIDHHVDLVQEMLAGFDSNLGAVQNLFSDVQESLT